MGGKMNGGQKTSGAKDLGAKYQGGKRSGGKRPGGKRPGGKSPRTDMIVHLIVYYTVHYMDKMGHLNISVFHLCMYMCLQTWVQI